MYSGVTIHPRINMLCIISGKSAEQRLDVREWEAAQWLKRRNANKVSCRIALKLCIIILKNHAVICIMITK